MIIAPQNFRDEELLEPKAVLEKAGITVIIASKDVKRAIGMLGTSVNVDIDVKDIQLSEFDSVIFIGGSGSSVYFNDYSILNLARQAFKDGKIIGAICIAPVILANAGILTGKKATVFPSQKQALISNGAVYTGKDIEVSGNIITADGPGSAKKFGEEILKKLKKI